MYWFKENWLILLSIALALIAVITICLIAASEKKKFGSTKASTKEVTYAAICIATSFALSFFGYSLPQGGTITPASVLPVMLYCHYYGVRKGFIVCLSLTLLQFMQNPYLLTPFQVILDYFLPYLAIIFSAVIPFDRKKYSSLLHENKSTMRSHLGFFIGASIYAVVRYVSHVLSGAIFFGEYAWAGWNAWPYSMVYNLFSIVDAGIAVGVGAMLFANKAFAAFMAKSFNPEKKTNGGTKDDNGTASCANER